MFSFALFALALFGYALVSKRISSTMVTGPMLFAGLGLLVGPESLDIITVELDSEFVQLLLEGTLVLVLFADAAVIDVRAARREAFLPGRLLGIGLPLTIIAGVLAALVLFDQIGMWQALVISVILAPTDAALGQAVVANESVPAMVRQGLNVESGLNDGIAVPFLTIAIAGAANEMATGGEILNVFAAEIGLAILAGLFVGWGGAALLKAAGARGWVSSDWRLLVAPILALLAFALADPIGGSGFIAAFVGGITFGHLVRDEHPDICDFSESISHLLTVIVFFLFGALLLGPSLELISWQMVVFGVVSLTAVRMVPVAVALIGTGMRLNSIAFIGWFGPRGLASLVFAGTVVVETDPMNGPFIIASVSTVVAMSVVAHGMTAVPWSRMYGAWYGRHSEQGTEMSESMEVEHLANRRRLQVEPKRR